MPRTLLHHNINLSAGLITQYTEESASGALVVAENVDGFSPFLGLGKVPGGTLVSPNLTSPPLSLHQFEFTDYDLIRKRHQLVVRGSGIARINDPLGTPSATSLTSPTGLFVEPLRSADMLNRIHFTSENQYELPTGGVKYDGTRITNWGVASPGSARTTMEAFNDQADWVLVGNGTKATNTTVKRDNTASVQLTKNSGGANTISLTKSSLSLNFSNAGEDLMFYWIFIPSGSLSIITSISLTFNSGAATARYDVTPGDLLTGWNLISALLTDPDGSGGGWTDANLATVDQITLRVNTTSGAASFTGMLFDQLYILSEGRPQPTLLDTDGLIVDETVSYRVTFVSDLGFESNAGPVSDSVSPTTEAASGLLSFAGQPADGDTVTFDEKTYTFKTTISGSGATNEVLRGSTAAEARDNLVSALEDTGVATGILTFSAPPNNGDSVTIGNIVYFFRTTLSPAPTAREVLIGASAVTARDNLRKAINADGISGIDYTNIGIPNQFVSAENGAVGTSILVTARNAGEAESATALLEDSGGVRMSWDKTTLLIDEYRGVGQVHSTVTGAASGADMTVTARQTGSAGNDIATTETSAVLSFGGSTLSGGRNGDQVSVSLPVSPDSQVVARRLYRDLNGDAIYRFVAEITNNTTTSYTDNTPGVSLGDQPPIAGDEFIDHSPPERMRDFISSQSRIFGISAESPNTILISDVNQPEAFPLLNRLVVEDELVAVREHYLGILFFSSDKIYLLTGDGVSSVFRLELVNTQVGANGPDSVLRIKGIVLTMREHEVFLVADPTDAWMINATVLDLFRQIDPVALPDVHIAHDRSRFRVVFFGQSTAGGAYDIVLVYQYGTTGFQQIVGDGQGSDPQDLRVGVWYTLSLPTAYNPQCSEIVEVTGNEVPQLWVGSAAAGYVYRLNDPAAVANWEVGGAADEAVTMAWESAALPLGTPPQVARGTPRFVRLNVNHDGAATNLSVIVKTFSGPGGRNQLDSKTITVSLPSGTGGESSVIVPVPMMRRGEWVRVRVEHSAAALAGSLHVTSCQLQYIPRFTFRGRQAS